MNIELTPEQIDQIVLDELSKTLKNLIEITYKGIAEKDKKALKRVIRYYSTPEITYTHGNEEDAIVKYINSLDKSDKG